MKGIWDSPLLGSAMELAGVGMDLCALGSPSKMHLSPCPFCCFRRVYGMQREDSRTKVELGFWIYVFLIAWPWADGASCKSDKTSFENM